MPAKMNMVISNGNKLPPQFYSRTASSTLGSITKKAPTAPTALNASIIARIHTVKPGCGSCGR